MATTEHSKHGHTGRFNHKSHEATYSDNHKHFHANSTAPSGFHVPHHASTAPNLTAITSRNSASDNGEETFPPQPSHKHQQHHDQQPPHSHTFHLPHPHTEFITHHQRELSFGHDSRHAKHDARASISQQMPTYSQEPSRLTEAEEIKLFAEQEAERKRLAELDSKSWEKIVEGRAKASHTSGAAYAHREIVEEVMES